MHAYISSVKWLLSHYKEWNSTSCNKIDILINTRSLKRVTEGSHWKNPSGCPFPWSQSWELCAALLVPVFQELIRNRESLRNGTQRKMQHIGSLKVECPLRNQGWVIVFHSNIKFFSMIISIRNDKSKISLGYKMSLILLHLPRLIT